MSADDPTPEPPGSQHREATLKRVRASSELERLEKEISEVEAYRMPLMEHLIELKNRLIWALGALVVGCGIGFYFAKEIYEVLTAPFVEALVTSGLDGGLSMVNSPFEGIYAYFRVSLIAGMLIASPVVSYQMWLFIAPGLYRTERRVVVPLSMASVFLFASGAAFCFYLIFPYAFPFFIEVLGVDVNLSVDGYLKAVIRMMLAFGICFQLPVGAWFLARGGFVDAQDMIASMRYAVVVIFVLAAIITPPDPMTQLLLATPMVLLYILSIGIVKLASTKVRDAEAPIEAP